MSAIFIHIYLKVLNYMVLFNSKNDNKVEIAFVGKTIQLKFILKT